MYLPRSLISHLYLELVQSQHALSPPVLILAALEPDALCACRILCALLKRDYIPHKIKPIAGYGDLLAAGAELVQPMRLSDGGTGGVVVCLGVGGLIDLANILGLEPDEGGNVDANGVDIWVLDARRPYNLANIFGSVSTRNNREQPAHEALPGTSQGQLSRTFKMGRGGIIVWDDGDIIEDLQVQKTAHFALERMRNDVAEMDEINEYGEDDDSDRGSQTSSSNSSSVRKRKSWELDVDDSASESDHPRPLQRRRSNSVGNETSHSQVTANCLKVRFPSNFTEQDAKASNWSRRCLIFIYSTLQPAFVSA